jgi:hypothetical protein
MIAINVGNGSIPDHPSTIDVPAAISNEHRRMAAWWCSSFGEVQQRNIRRGW